MGKWYLTYHGFDFMCLIPLKSSDSTALDSLFNA